MPKRKMTTAHERWECLLEFDKEKHKRKTLDELAVVAKVLLKREDDFDPSTISYWRKNRGSIREQATAYAKRSKFDKRGQIKPVKNIISNDEFNFTEQLVDFFLKIADYKNLTIRVMVFEAQSARPSEKTAEAG